MFDHSYFLNGVFDLIDGLLNLYLIVVIARVVISWVSPDPYNRIVQILCALTDPPLNALRRVIPRLFWSTGLDFTPLILTMIILIIRRFLQSIHL
ncbi:MAG: YggT family protein [Candidatus Latescibacterota bacterium]|nr:YggT family protein [Candidatus Latescibacterota bacterium]